jgi:hypothetical protein
MKIKVKLQFRINVLNRFPSTKTTLDNQFKPIASSQH